MRYASAAAFLLIASLNSHIVVLLVEFFSFYFFLWSHFYVIIIDNWGVKRTSYLHLLFYTSGTFFNAICSNEKCYDYVEFYAFLIKVILLLFFIQWSLWILKRCEGKLRMQPSGMEFFGSAALS